MVFLPNRLPTLVQLDVFGENTLTIEGTRLSSTLAETIIDIYIRPRFDR